MILRSTWIRLHSLVNGRWLYACKHEFYVKKSLISIINLRITTTCLYLFEQFFIRIIFIKSKIVFFLFIYEVQRHLRVVTLEIKDMMSEKRAFCKNEESFFTYFLDNACVSHELDLLADIFEREQVPFSTSHYIIQSI